MVLLPQAFIGCAGWSISSAHTKSFGAGDSVLARYATRFNAVEINSSFYRPHQRKTYQRWAAAVPEYFRFSVKAPKTITQIRRLHQAGAELDRFVHEIGGLGEKLALVLVQLPPSLAFDARTANVFFAMLRRRVACGIACEPRHASWFTAAADAIWTRHGVTRVAADPALCAQACNPAGDGTWRYWRWHGAPRIYYSDYPDSALKKLAADVCIAAAAGATPWIIFDNTALGHATANAIRLQSLLSHAAGAL